MSKVESRMELARNELLSDVAEQVSQVLKGFNINEEVADQCGSNIADHLADHWGGQHITIPRDYAYKLSQRDLEIWEKSNSQNIAQLTKQYNITQSTLYRILNRVRRRLIDRNQHDLFKEH